MDRLDPLPSSRRMARFGGDGRMGALEGAGRRYTRGAVGRRRREGHRSTEYGEWQANVSTIADEQARRRTKLLVIYNRGARLALFARGTLG